MLIGIKIDGFASAVTVEQRVEEARRAARAGLARVWSGEPTNGDALTALAVVGREVPGIGLGTAIVHSYPRHPLVLANQALTVQAATGNRLTLGIGPGAQFLVERDYGLSYAAPAKHTREYLSVLEPLLHGAEVSFDGTEIATQSSATVPGAEPPPLLLAALGPAMLRLAGERADGAVTAFTGPKAIADHIVPKLSQAAATSGKADPRVAAGITVCVTNDVAEIRAAMAEQFGFFGEMPSYRAMLDLEGVAGVEDVAIVGNEAAIEREVRRYADAGATELIVSLFGSESDRVRTVELMGELARAADRVATATA